MVGPDNSSDAASERFWASDAAVGLSGIDGLWCFQEASDERAQALDTTVTQFVPPDGCADLILRFESGRFQNAFVLEPAEHFEVVSIAAREALYGVRFELGSGGAIVRQRKRVERIAERAFEGAPTHEPRSLLGALAQLGASLLEDLVSERPDWLLPALARVQAMQGVSSVATLAREVGVSERTLHRGFSAWVGATPKQLCRTIRARAAVELAGGQEPLVEVAAALGFSDQSHLSRELRELWGTTPGQIRRREPSPASRLLSDFFKTTPSIST